MKVSRTKRLTILRALQILQLRYGSQVQSIKRNKDKYIVDSICCVESEITREDVLKIENEMYLSFGV